jgi:MFS family permease
MPSVTKQAKLWSPSGGPSVERVARQLDVYGAMQATMTQLSSGVFLTAYALSLRADPLAIATIASVPFAAKVSQVFTSAHIERAGHWPATALACATISRVLLLAAAAIPVFTSGGSSAARALVVIVALSSLAGSFFDLALLTWMAELVPPSIRGSFLGTRNRISGIAGQVTALLAAVALQYVWGPSGQQPPIVFAALFGCAGIIGLAGIPLLAQVPPPRRLTSRVETPSLTKMLITPVRDRNFRTFLWFAVVWHVALGLSGPFLIVFMLRELRLSLLEVTALSALTSTAAAVTMKYWGTLGDHFGSKTVVRAGVYLISFPTVLWLIVTPERTWPILVVQLVMGLGWGAYNANVNNMVLKIAPQQSGPSYVATLGAVAGSAEAVGPIIGGILVSIVRESTSSPLLPYYLLIVITFALRAIATIVPGHVHETGGVPVGRMVRTMARYRSMNVEETFSPLFTHLYSHLARVADFIAREPAMAKREPREA